MTATAYLALTSALVLACAWAVVAGLRRAAHRLDAMAASGGFLLYGRIPIREVPAEK